MQSNKLTETVHTHYDSEGRAHFVEVTVNPVRDSNGDIVRFVHMTRDVTEVVKTRETLKRMEDLNKFMFEREEMIIAIKKEVNELLQKLGKPRKYDIT